MREKVFITGGSGLLALNWALTIRENYSVVLGLFDKDIYLTDVQVQYISLESVYDFTKVLETIQPNLVIHTAGLTNVETCEAYPDLAQHINVDLSINVAKACSKLKLPLIHISTDHLYSGDDSLIKETTPTSPLNVYGKTKAEAELRVLEENTQALVVRTNFFGWGPSYRKSFSDTIIDTLRDKKPLNLFKDVFYTPIHVETLANASHELIDKGYTGIYNVVGDERLSKYEFGIKLAEYFKLNKNMIKPVLMSEVPELVQRPYDMSLSNEKTCNVLGHKLGRTEEQISKLLYQEQRKLTIEIQNL